MNIYLTHDQPKDLPDNVYVAFSLGNILVCEVEDNESPPTHNENRALKWMSKDEAQKVLDKVNPSIQKTNI